MYRYDEFDQAFVKARVAPSSVTGVDRRLAGEIWKTSSSRRG